MKRYLFTFLFSSLLIGSVHAQLDTNNNGMSDIWERHFNDGELFPPGILAEGDEDGDGQSNLAESLAGTDPFEFSIPDGYFKADVRHVPEDLGGPGPGNPEAYEISWHGVAGKKYILQGSTDLQNWIPITTEMGEGEEIIIACFPEDENDVPEIRFFWRVKVEDVDSDGDGLTDYEEILYGTDPNDSYSNGWVDDLWLATHYKKPNDFDPYEDDDGDGVLNIDEYWYETDPHNEDTDGDGMPDGWEIDHGFDPLDSSDAYDDDDNDGLVNLAEYLFGSDPLTPDTFSTYPITWLTTHYQSFAAFDPNGDDDQDGLTNYQEFVNNTDPHDSDTDGDGVPDGTEVDQGSDPNNSADKDPVPPEQRENVKFTVGGDWAWWRMEIKGVGPEDERIFNVMGATSYGYNWNIDSPTNSETFSLRKGNKYEIRLFRVGGIPDWYCWEARIDGKPGIHTFDNVPSSIGPWVGAGIRNENAKHFTVANHWLVDNSSGLLSSHLHSENKDVATGLVATMIPVQFKVYPDEEIGPDKPHKMNMDTRQKEKLAYGGYEKFVGYVYKTGSVDLISYLDGADDPQRRAVFEEALKWQSNNTEIIPTLNWLQEPQKDKIKSYKIQVLSKTDNKVMDRLWITVVPRSTKTSYEEWETDNQNKGWLDQLPPLYSSLEEKQEMTVVVPTLPIPTTATVWRIPDPDRNCTPRIWETVVEHADNGYFHHPGAYFEIRSEETANGHGHQACYDENRSLIRNGLSAGTADKVHPTHWLMGETHLKNDVKPYIWALQLDGNPVEGVTIFDFVIPFTNLTRPIAYKGKYSDIYLDLRPPIANLKQELEPGTCPPQP